VENTGSVNLTELLELLICDSCGGKLTPGDSFSRLFCHQCNISYPIENGIPVLLLPGELSVYESWSRQLFNGYAEQAAKNEYYHWWYMARRCILISLMRKYMQLSKKHLKDLRKSAVAIDLGCGTGALGRAMKDELGITVFGLDLSLNELKHARRRNSLSVVCATVERMHLARNSFDIVIMADVIEHLDNDLLALQKAFAILKSGGIILITVPAYEWLRHPVSDISHKRRYTRATLTRVVEQAGFVTLTCSYMNSILFPLMMIQRLARKFVGKKEEKHTLVPPNALINRILYFLFVLESWALRILKFPYGGSVLCIAIKSPSGMNLMFGHRPGTCPDS
jgi:2-polyprenyl-3-methyl-5-hydroxy-6-metoxy-1,4-benzoquinol methylase